MSTVDWSHPAEGPAPIPELGARPDAPVAAVLALGANLREPAQTLDAAVAALSALPHITDVRASPRAVTTPVGGPPGQPDYLNQVVTLRTDLAPWELLAVAHRLEQDHHRRREVRWGARTLDVDVIAYGDVRSDHPDLTLPHPRAAERAFVLLPWLWLDADATLAGTPVADLAAVAADAPGVRRQEPERHRLLAGTDDVVPLRPARPDALGREAT
ncbi:2-amino-4-hydroxy-6-hydroxymethyldihydropteridine diphosphokinase [Micrococcus luteus]|uniref:2-amino-4-hydroxy-6- hydroxymethyldihydropteridine diphosphokinase n=1 Tax=Micrococcus luteus TaxID=1270 RepID=UPI001A9763AC|nr:2-amino-4-hydroxy-6-hydroxymethyldihydropteridine diphosphokinase [Micrococcus luteus]MCV7558923.1 2-amino-4-hydroxy-6-hydroxymethyldihydropteridine diphosphokinase [Micrococcus luteus]MCV7733528.1 2-amino-4-hydroxy-6-hydroxymethyldihydropteridine diphosphokinase [Micrococcus luteus]